MTRFGIHDWTLHHLSVGPEERLKLMHDFGADGFQFVSALDVSPSLDHGEIRSVLDYAQSLGMYVEIGIPKISLLRPDPACLEAGGGDYLEGLRRSIRAASLSGAAGMRTYIGMFPDRRGEGPQGWRSQRAITVQLLKLLAPVVRECGTPVAIETHTDITSYEVLEIIDSVGEDVVGVCLDPGNMPVAMEDPLAATRRLLDHVVMTHLKDCVVVSTEDGLAVQARALGAGTLPMTEIISMVREAHPHLPLTIEDHEGVFPVPMSGPGWSRDYPQLEVEEFQQVMSYVASSDAMITAGTIPSVQESESTPWGDQADARIHQSLAFARSV